jgi:methionyl-tRNA formyltransferase
MSNEPLYPYDEGDRLEQRNTYFFSPFHGQAFLTEWASRRDRAMVAAEGGFRQSQRATTPGQTDRRLTELHTAFNSGHVLDEHRQLLAKLIQRFEVTKRLHGNYSDAFRPTDANDYHEFSRYLEFAEVLVAAYKFDKGLPILNALLKCADTLCALRERLVPASQARLAEVIRAERTYVAELAHSLAITWPTS